MKNVFSRVAGVVISGSLVAFVALPALAHEASAKEPGMMASTSASMGEMHRSVVSKAVESLLKTAAKDGGIGAEVKAIATEQQDSSARAADAMKAVEARGKWKTLFLGSDYKNLGALRSELVTTQNHIDRLMKAKERTASTSVKAELDAEIAALQKSKEAAEKFVKDHESSISLFGWFVRIFNK